MAKGHKITLDYGLGYFTLPRMPMEKLFVDLHKELSRCDEAQAVEAAVGALNRDEKFTPETPQHALFDLYQRIHAVSFQLRGSHSPAALALEQFLDRIDLARREDIAEVKEYFDMPENRRAAAALQLGSSEEDTPARCRRVATLKHYAEVERKAGRIGPFSVYFDMYQEELRMQSLIRKFSEQEERMVRAARGDYGADARINALYDAQMLGQAAQKDERAKPVFESFIGAMEKEPVPAAVLEEESNLANSHCLNCAADDLEQKRAVKIQTAVGFAGRLKLRDRTRPATDCVQR